MKHDPTPDNAPYVSTIDARRADELLAGLKERGFEISKPAYTLFSARKDGVSCTVYTSGKLVVQGKKKAEFIEFFLEPEILQTFSHGYKEEVDVDLTPRIGIDESGKGDIYGPLCVAGVYGDADSIAALQKIGVRDSKKLNDKAIAVMAKKIQSSCRYHVVRISPTRYNQLYAEFRNLNRLLAWGHATAIAQLAEDTGCHTAIIDQFAAEEVVETALARKKLKIELTQRHRGEEDLVVAAASILARNAFLEGMARLSEEVGIQLPKGAGPTIVKIGRQLVARHGPEVLEKIAKMHFKTILEILG